MSRAWRTLLPAGILAAQLCMGQQSAKQPDDAQLPPEEDAALNAPKEYGFNPVQSKREVEAGMVYFKKGSYKAAAYRFSEATKWNDSNAEAWLRLGEAEEKRGNAKEAAAAYRHFLEVNPEGKNAGDVQKRIARLK